MQLADICAMPVSEIAAPDSVLFLWATSPKLAEAMQVVSSWGFDYRTSMVWTKPQLGLGYYARIQHELLLIATRGNPGTPTPPNRPRSVQHFPRGKHSQKPDLFYDLIERMYPAPTKLELFARRARPGWMAWGNEAPPHERNVSL